MAIQAQGADSTAIYGLRWLIALLDTGQASPVTRVIARTQLITMLQQQHDVQSVYTMANEVLARVRAMTSVQKQAIAIPLAQLATSMGRRPMSDSSYESSVFIAKAATLFADIPTFLAWVTMASDRRALINTPAPELVAERWLNTPAGITQMRFNDGTVTIIAFVAHWCGPCKESYGPLVALSDSLGSRGLRVVFATQLYGTFQEHLRVSAAEEITLDDQLFRKEYGIRFPIAIADNLRIPSDDHTTPDTNVNSKAYFVNGMPHFIIVDRHGIIREMLFGWESGQEKKLANAVIKFLGR
jgi:thiol-disulfide isomerase/thioredoxin